jgi:hypothetical protein
MAYANQSGDEVPHEFLRLHHGTDHPSATDLLQNGVDQQHAAAWNGSGEFWATTDHARAEWFALSHPSSPPAACFEFEVPRWVLQTMLQAVPPLAMHQVPDDYEFFPGSYAQLNQHMTNRRIVPVP